MGRTVNEARITTRNARAKLQASKTPYWRAIDRGLHLGYRKGKDGGTWVGRLKRSDGKYVTCKLGTADDVVEADGTGVLTYSQAQDAVRRWATEPEGGSADRRQYTVERACSDYLAWLRKHRKAVNDAEYRARVHILPQLGGTPVDQLTARQIRQWHEKLAESSARLRTRPGDAQQWRDDGDDPDSSRRRKSSANRVLTILKAALNQAYRDGKVGSDDAWRRVRPFRNVDEPNIRYLSEAECKRLVAACPADFGDLVQAALYTGCRYGELTALNVGDFDGNARTLRIATSKSGRPRYVILTDEASAFFKQLCADRAADAPLLVRDDGQRWAKSQQKRRLEEACQRAGISPAINFHILRHTHASMLAMQGVPMAVIAHQLGHADERMVQRHYAHLSPSYIADTIRNALPRFGLT